MLRFAIARSRPIQRMVKKHIAQRCPWCASDVSPVAVGGDAPSHASPTSRAALPAMRVIGVGDQDPRATAPDPGLDRTAPAGTGKSSSLGQEK